MVDTVGFVRNLPHQLVEAFRSTIEEVADADLIVHVVDASHPDPASQIRTVRDVIGEAEASSISVALSGVVPDRPLTHDLMLNTISELGGEAVMVV